MFQEWMLSFNFYECSLLQFRSDSTIFWRLFSSGSLYVCHLCIITKSSRQKIWDRCTPFFGMLVFVVCIVACFNEVLLLAFVHYSFTSVSICQNLLIELVDRLNQKISKGTNSSTRVTCDFYIHINKNL